MFTLDQIEKCHGWNGRSPIFCADSQVVFLDTILYTLTLRKLFPFILQKIKVTTLLHALNVFSTEFRW